MTSTDGRLLDAAGLAALDASVDRALDTGDESGLLIIGFGEITLVLGWPVDAPAVAAKRLPLFPDADRAAAYGRVIDDYLAVLAGRGLDAVRSEYATVRRRDGRVAGYVVQEVLPPTSLAPAAVCTGDPRPVLEAIADTVVATVDETVGIDGQLSNWAWVDDRLRYFDVTTPILRDATGRARLDVELLLSPLPALLRPAVRRFVAPEILDRFHDPRRVLLDLAGNLLKERLDDVLPTALDVIAGRVTPAVTREEVERWYRSDARTWELLLRLRRADRWWQRRVRRRPYPFLLPGKISR